MCGHVGVLVEWCASVLMCVQVWLCWCMVQGCAVCRCADAQVSWCVDVRVHGCTNILQCSGAQCAVRVCCLLCGCGVQVYRCAGMQVSGVVAWVCSVY